MPEAVIISAGLDTTALDLAIDKLVKNVESKLDNAAHQFEKNVGRMQIALDSLAKNAKSRVVEIQQSFTAMGTTFQDFATAMERAARAAAAAGSGSGGAGGNGGGNGGNGGNGAAQDTVKWLKEQIELQKKKIDEQKLFTQELQREVNLLAQQKELLKQQTTPKVTLDQQNARKRMQGIMTIPTNDLADAERKLRRLRQLLQQTQGTNLLNEQQINRVKNAIQQVTEKVEKLRASAAIPTTTQGVLGMSAGNLNEIQAKMAAITKLRATLPVGSQDIKTLNIEYAKLSKMQDEILGKNLRLVQSNNALGRAFRYIANRLAFALSIGAVTSFVRQLYEVRGQYELLERSLGVLVNSFEKGTQIFNELNEMAIKSPFTLIELGTAAKQLSAYNFAADEVVDTTKRLADISSALGVPIERLVYNLGQIKAQGVLNARDARDFANAGLAIVPMLAEMYTAEKRYGDQVVTTAQVYSMMSKKLVTYHDVLKVINQVTDEGGKFFDFQAKQAGTLKVQLANLTIAWNNMLNEIGTEEQTTLTKPIKLLRDLFKEWRNVERIIKTVILTLGTYKAISLMALASDKIAVALVQWGSLSKAIKAATAEMAIFNAISKLNPIGLAVGALVALVGYFGMFNNEIGEASEQVLMFGESASKAIDKVETLYKVLKGTDKTSSTYKENMHELNDVLREYGVETIKEGDNIDVVNEKRKEAIELIKLESAERERANNLKKAQEQYDQQIDALRQELNKKLKEAITIKGGFLGINIVGGEEELRKNADAISDIVTQVVTSNIDEVAGKSGKELEKGLDKIFTIIQSRMRAIGISEGVITKEWLENAFFATTSNNIIDEFINKVRLARESQERYNDATEKNYQAAKKATESTMTFTQRVEANARALRNNAKDALELYNRVMDIVKVAEQNHVINFDIKLTAEKPPQWMFDKSLQDLEKFARNFAAIAQSASEKGANVNGTWFTREELYERSLQYASAAREKQYQDERKAQEDLNKTKDKTSKKNKVNKKTTDELAEALKNEISIIKKLQSEYDKLVKAGASQKDALEIVQNTYTSTIAQLNSVMRKYKLPELDLSIIKGKNPNDVLQFFTNLRNVLSEKGLTNLARIKAVDGVIEEFTVSAKTYNLEKITKGLNNELDKIKEEYELGVELDANPELGSIFADMMGISKEEIMDMPRDFQGVLKRMQQAIDATLGDGKFSLTDNLNKSNFDAWVTEQGNTLEDGFAQALNKIREYVNKVRLDENKKIISDWDKLLEKYGEYEYKRLRIEKETEDELEKMRKRGYDSDLEKAIRNEGEQKLSKLNFEKFQKSAEWILATGDLSKLATGALQMLIDRLNEYKRTEKNLKPEQLKKINKVLRDLRKEVLKNNPFSATSIALIQMGENVELVEEQIADLEKKIDEMNVQQIEMKIVDPKQQKILQEMREELERLKRLLALLGKRPPEDWLGDIAGYASKFKQITSSISQIADEINDTNLKKVADAADDIIGNIEAAEKGAETWGGWWGAIIGGVTDAIPKILKWTSGNADIDKKVQKSQQIVKQLENTYKELEYAASKAYGVQAYGAQKAMIANKNLQLAELERQLTLEKSRKSKYQDKNAILELESQIIDLKHEIQDATENIVNDLLGISSVGDFAESLVKNMIEAFKSGEDYMKVFEESFEDMVDNMIMKAIVSRLIGDWINNLFDQIKKNTTETSRAQAAQSKLDEISRLQAENDAKIANLENDLSSKAVNDIFGDQIRAELERLYRLRDQLNQQMSDAINEYNQAVAPTPEDVNEIRDMVEQGKDSIKEQFDAWMSLFGVQFGQNAGENADLSALQQGITNISETTAEALEAYMNSVSQQVYYQSDILTQIRDILVNFGGDITIATNAQILFELQQSYQVQMSIQSILQGWSNANGLAVRVELAN